MYRKGKARASIHLLQPWAVWGCSLCRSSPGKTKKGSDPATWFMHLVAALLHIIASRPPALWKKHKLFALACTLLLPILTSGNKPVTEKESGGMSTGSPSLSPGPLAAPISHATFPIPPLPRCWTCCRIGAVWLGCCSRDSAGLCSAWGPLVIDQGRQ